MLPLVIAQAFIIGLSALGPVLVAEIGSEAINAVSTVEYLNFLLVNVFVALGAAGSVVVAQSVGGGHKEAVRAAGGVTIWVTTVPATAVAVVAVVFREPIVHALLGGAGPQTEAYGRIYLLGLALSYPAQALVEAISATLRGIGRTAPSLYLTVITNGGYLALAFLLARVLDLGMPAIAWSSVIARYVAAGAAVLLARRTLPPRGPVLWPLQRALVRRVAILGLPFVIEQLFFNGGKLVIQVFVVGMGTAAITTNAMASSLISLSEIIPAAMIVGLVPIVGQAVGAGRIADARMVARSFVRAATVIAVLMSLPMLAVFPWLLDLYHTPQEIRGQVLAVFLVSLAGRVTGWWAFSWVLPSALRAAGDAVFTTAVATVAMALRVTFIWLVGVQLGGGVVGVWAVMVVEWGGRALAFWLRLRGQAWYRHRAA